MASIPERSQIPLVAFLDANVLWGQDTTDLLMNLAVEKVIDAKWSPDVLSEVRRTVLAKRPDMNIDRRLASMGMALPTAAVTGYQDRIPQMPAHAGDQHVLAAAMHCDAHVLVLNNVKHFHPDREKLDIRIATLDDFCRGLLHREPRSVEAALRRMVAAHRRPPRTLTEFVECAAERLQLSGFAADLNQRLPPDQRSADPRLASRRPLSATGRSIAGLPAIRPTVRRRTFSRRPQLER